MAHTHHFDIDFPPTLIGLFRVPSCPFNFVEESEGLLPLHSHKVGLLYEKLHHVKKQIKVNNALKVRASLYFTLASIHFIFFNTLFFEIWDGYIYIRVCVFSKFLLISQVDAIVSYNTQGENIQKCKRDQ